MPPGIAMFMSLQSTSFGHNIFEPLGVRTLGSASAGWLLNLCCHSFSCPTAFILLLKSTAPFLLVGALQVSGFKKKKKLSGSHPYSGDEKNGREKSSVEVGV